MKDATDNFYLIPEDWRDIFTHLDIAIVKEEDSKMKAGLSEVFDILFEEYYCKDYK